MTYQPIDRDQFTASTALTVETVRRVEHLSTGLFSFSISRPASFLSLIHI